MSTQHYIKQKDRKEIECACGCGQKLLNHSKWGIKREYINGHNRRKWWLSKENPVIECACGCGQKLLKYHRTPNTYVYERKYIKGHYQKYVQTPSWNVADNNKWNVPINNEGLKEEFNIC